MQGTTCGNFCQYHFKVNFEVVAYCDRLLATASFGGRLSLPLPQLLQEGAHVFGKGRFEGVEFPFFIFEVQ